MRFANPFNSKIGTAFDKSIADVNCVNCGQCIQACPTGALREKDDLDYMNSRISNIKDIKERMNKILAEKILFLKKEERY